MLSILSKRDYSDHECTIHYECITNVLARLCDSMSEHGQFPSKLSGSFDAMIEKCKCSKIWKLREVQATEVGLKLLKRKF